MNIEERRLMDKYRAVLFSPLGMEVLGDILINFCNFGCYLDPDNKMEIGEYNVGVGILSRLGVFSKEAPNYKVIMALSGVLPEIPEEAREVSKEEEETE